MALDFYKQEPHQSGGADWAKWEKYKEERERNLEQAMREERRIFWVLGFCLVLGAVGVLIIL